MKQLLFLALLSILSLTSCKVDPEAVLPGKWHHSYEDQYGRQHTFTWEIKEDGKFTLVNNKRPNAPEAGKWNYDPNGRKFSIDRGRKIENYYIKSIENHYVYMTRKVAHGRYVSTGSVHLKRFE